MRRLLLDLDDYGGTDSLGMFPIFLKKTDVMAPCLSVVFRRLVRLETDDGKVTIHKIQYVLYC